MFCKRCGKDIVGTNKCLYCGKIVDDFIIGGGGAVTDSVSNNPTSNENYGGTSAGGYSDSNYDLVDNTPEGFYERYQDTSSLENGKRIIDKVKKGLLIAGLVAFVALIVSIAMESNIVPELFGFDVYNGTEEEMFEFINKLFMVFLSFFLIPLVLTCVSEILDWRSMVSFSEEIKSNNIDGESLLTKNRLSDANGKKEYMFVSNSLCLIDVPSQKTAIGVKVIVKAILNIALIVVLMNFISYLTLTLMPAMEDPENLYVMMYTSNEFWLDPNILSIGILFWANLIVNSITNTVVNKKYSRWIKNKKEKGEKTNEVQ